MGTGVILTDTEGQNVKGTAWPSPIWFMNKPGSCPNASPGRRRPRACDPAVFAHLRSLRGSLPQLAGEGGAQRRMGCGPLLRRQTACTNVTANLRSKRPAFRTPSVAFGDTFPAAR
jgi:hypothetical protein